MFIVMNFFCSTAKNSEVGLIKICVGSSWQCLRDLSNFLLALLMFVVDGLFILQADDSLVVPR